MEIYRKIVKGFAKVFLPPTEAFLRDGHAQELWRRVVRITSTPHRTRSPRTAHRLLLVGVEKR